MKIMVIALLDLVPMEKSLQCTRMRGLFFDHFDV
ncbi:hypothetical protein SAMN04489868_10665 [Pisciglobus halotolerans]|uniref:Uncharacterized protein n=1 Tax=Pisciglobus halotolerans TaxID=745365 RepID=A0A1I3BG48_9LACT|nr:hypothetical protein SAMN04489868_10665 [Pisciglobus halotolerans]